MSLDNKKEIKKNIENFQNKEYIQTQNINNKKKLNKGPYLLGQLLGEGAFAKVRLATQIHIKEKCAIKIVDKRLLENVNDIQRLRKEIKILKKIRHKNIIQLYDIMESKTNLYFVMEYCKGGELFDFIVKKKRLTEEEACNFFHQIINGIEYLHNQGIIHRDLKPENLLLDDKNQIKISDFGLSTFFTKDNYLQTACGTPSYAPPEMLEGLQYNGEASDIWSCGIILYAMLCGALPFTESKEDIIVEKIKKHEYKIPDYLSKEAQDILNHILKINPQERYSIESIKIHPWFNIIKPHLIKGISVDNIKIPVDDKILDMVKNYGFNPDECRELLLKNKFCSLTSIYYLCLKKYVREGGKSISDLESDLFENYINNPNNYISKIDNKNEEEKNNSDIKKNPQEEGIKPQTNKIDKNKKSDSKNEKVQNNSKRKLYNPKNENKNGITPKKKEKLNINSKANDIIIINKYIKPNSYSTDKKTLNNIKDKLLIEKHKEKEIDFVKKEEKNHLNSKSIKNKKKETSLRNHKNTISNNNQKVLENNKFINLKDKKYIKKTSQNKELSAKDENNKESKKQNKKNRNNISLHNIQNKIFSYENHNFSKKLNQNEFSYKTINDHSKNKNYENKKETTKKNNYLSPNKNTYIKKCDKQLSNKVNNIIIPENYCDKTFSHNNDNINNINEEISTKETFQNYKNYIKKGVYEVKNKNSPFPMEKLILSKDDEIKLLETEKPLNVINYIAKKLVSSSFYGNLNFEYKNRNIVSKRNSEIYEKPLDSNINLLTNKEKEKEKNEIENNKSIDNLFNNDGNFKNLISVLNQKFKNYLSKENSKNGIHHNQKNRSMKNSKFILNNLEYNNYYLDEFKNLNELTPTQKSSYEKKIDFFSNNTNIDAYSYNINNMISHYNNCLDISTNYDPGIDSKGETSLDKVLSINKKELRYSISLDKKKNENNMNIINLDCLRNNGGVNTSHNKYSKNINVISEDDEFNEFSKDKDNNGNAKYIKNKDKYLLADKKVSINLTTTFNSVPNSDNSDNKKNK